MGRTAGIWPYVCLAPALVVFFLLEIVPAFATSIFSLTDYTGLPGAADPLGRHRQLHQPVRRPADVSAARARRHGDLLADGHGGAERRWRC